MSNSPVSVDYEKEWLRSKKTIQELIDKLNLKDKQMETLLDTIKFLLGLKEK